MGPLDLPRWAWLVLLVVMCFLAAAVVVKMIAWVL